MFTNVNSFPFTIGCSTLASKCQPTSSKKRDSILYASRALAKPKHAPSFLALGWRLCEICVQLLANDLVV